MHEECTLLVLADIGELDDLRPLSSLKIKKLTEKFGFWFIYLYRRQNSAVHTYKADGLQMSELYFWRTVERSSSSKLYFL